MSPCSSTCRLALLAAAGALPLVASAQTQGPQPVAPRPQLLEGVQLIVNDEAITSNDLVRLATMRGSDPSNQRDIKQLLEESANDLTRNLLMQQAGRDLGYDPNLIKAMVRDEKERKKVEIGSITALAEAFEQAHMDSADFNEAIEGHILRSLWEMSTKGVYPGAGGRHYVDRYVRPGQLGLEFKRLGSKLDLPAKVVLQEMIIAPRADEDLQGARQRAMLVRARARRGEDFAALNAEFGVPGFAVDLDPMEESKFANVPDVEAFIRSAAPGDVSELLPATSASGKVGGFRIVRLVERIAGVAKSFEDRAFQEELRRAQIKKRDDFLVERALRRLMDAAYIWPPEVAGRGAPRKPTQEPAPAEAPALEPPPVPVLPPDSPFDSPPPVRAPDEH
jgi:hypothetical protein